MMNSTAAVNTVNGIREQINSLVNFPERNELDEDEALAELGVSKDYYIEAIPKLQSASLIFDVGSSFGLYLFEIWVRYDE